MLHFVKLYINIYCTPKLVVYKMEDLLVYINTRYNDIIRLLCWTRRTLTYYRGLYRIQCLFVLLNYDYTSILVFICFVRAWGNRS